MRSTGWHALLLVATGLAIGIMIEAFGSTVPFLGRPLRHVPDGLLIALIAGVCVAIWQLSRWLTPR